MCPSMRLTTPTPMASKPHAEFQCGRRSILAEFYAEVSLRFAHIAPGALRNNRTWAAAIPRCGFPLSISSAALLRVKLPREALEYGDGVPVGESIGST